MPTNVSLTTSVAIVATPDVNETVNFFLNLKAVSTFSELSRTVLIASYGNGKIIVPNDVSCKTAPAAVVTTSAKRFGVAESKTERTSLKFFPALITISYKYK